MGWGLLWCWPENNREHLARGESGYLPEVFSQVRGEKWESFLIFK